MPSLYCNPDQAVAPVHRPRVASATTTMAIGRRGAAMIVTMMVRADVKWDRRRAVRAAGPRLAAPKVAAAVMCAVPVVPDAVDSLAGRVVRVRGPIECQQCAAGRAAPAGADFPVGLVQVRALDEAWVRPAAIPDPLRSPSSFSAWSASLTRCCAN